MNAKHTMGPWNVDDERYYVRADASGELVADCYTFTETDRGRIIDASCAANARLIAAAPELLLLLKALRRTIISMGGDLEVTAPQSINATTFMDDVRRIDAAISKAEGKS